MVVNVGMPSCFGASAANADDMTILLVAGLPGMDVQGFRKGLPLMKQDRRRARAVAIAIAERDVTARLALISFAIAAFSTVAFLMLPTVH